MAIIEDTEEARKKIALEWGTDEVKLTKDEQLALLAGKCVTFNVEGEYTVFLTFEN